MTNLPVGLIVLIVVSALIYLGAAHRVLDRLRLTDKAALAILAALALGSLIDIPFAVGNITFVINVGGALVPIGLAIFLISKVETASEKIRPLVAALVTGAVVFSLGTFLMNGIQEPQGRFPIIDIIFLYPVVAALLATILGRSRRGAWIAATLGVLLADVFTGALLAARGLSGTVHFGGGGVFDVVVVAGILAVLLTEVVGETRERLGGGPQEEEHDHSRVVNAETPGKYKGGRENEE